VWAEVGNPDVSALFPLSACEETRVTRVHEISTKKSMNTTSAHPLPPFLTYVAAWSSFSNFG